MKPIVFLGPTLPHAIARQELDAEYLPPAAQGDVYRAARRQPDAIGLIDGYFERVPAVWHKEILWAMQHGVRVFGAASMGALRAAELCTFGMEGVGRIFCAFRDGLLEDDDEVAVAHADAEAGYRVASEAMVNVRATLEAAVAQEVMAEGSAAILLAAAKELFYADRTYPAIAKEAKRRGAAATDVEAFEEWLGRGHVDQKGIDAREMLVQMRQRLGTGERPPARAVRMEETVFWERAMMGGRVEDGSSDGLPLEAVLDELRLEGQSYGDLRNGALLRAMATELVRRRRLDTSAHRASATIRMRRELGLAGPAALRNWLTANGLGNTQFAELVAEEAALGWGRSTYSNQVKHFLLSELRTRGHYPSLLSRALDKRQTLVENGLDSFEQVDDMPSLTSLLHWHFTERLHQPVPQDVAAYARSLDLAGTQSLEEMLRREWMYRRSGSKTTSAGARP